MTSPAKKFFELCDRHSDILEAAYKSGSVQPGSVSADELSELVEAHVLNEKDFIFSLSDQTRALIDAAYDSPSSEMP